ncbi:MAG: DNA methyltransferase, partial [Euryarchaeota archaeon]|nr:DNA methyltransferase [Euryarchaeota archaeon]
MNVALTPDLNLEGRPKEVYDSVLQLLKEVNDKKVSAEDLLVDIIRCLLTYKNQRQKRMNEFLKD